MQFLIDIGLFILYFCIFLLLCAWSWRFWVMYAQQKALGDIDWLLLEIKLPREVNKSPLATEMAIASLLQSGGIGNKVARIYKGGLPVFASLEIASLEGVIHFYVRIQKKFRSLVEANFYAQYPGIEIVEADDYTTRIHYHHLSKDTALWGTNYRTAKTWVPTDPKTGDPQKGVKLEADFLPIKTYVDYGLEKDPKEEFKVDPLSSLLEIMGSMGKGEYFWYQILVSDEGVYDGSKMPKFYVNKDSHEHFTLREMADMRKKQIRTAGYVKHGDQVLDEYGYEKPPRKIPNGVDAEGKSLFTEVPLTYNIKEDKDGNRVKASSKKEMELTPEEKDELELINKKFTKPLALCVMRALYIAKKENSNVGANVQNVLSLTKPFAGANGFKPISLSSPYDYDWQDMGKKRSSWRGEEKFEEYAEREGFYPHIKGRDTLDRWEDFFFWTSTMKHRKIFRMMYEAIFYPFEHPQAEQAFVLNLEELATLWHLPGATASTPTLPRIDSTKGVAPANLPV